MAEYANGILEEIAADESGTGNLNLTELGNFRAFSDKWSTGGTDVFKYFIRNDGAEEMEFGTGHLVDATTLARDTVLWSTNANSLVDFSAGNVKVVTNEFALDSSGELLLPATNFGASKVSIDPNGGVLEFDADASTTPTLISVLEGGANRWDIKYQNDKIRFEDTNNSVNVLDVNHTGGITVKGDGITATEGDHDLGDNQVAIGSHIYQDKSGSTAQWVLEERGVSGSFIMQQGGTVYWDFRDEGDWIRAPQGWGSDSGTTAIINSSGQLQKSSSARRFKEEIQDWNDPSILESLQPKRYRNKNHLGERKEMEVGLVAEDVLQAVGEEFVTWADPEKTELQSVKYRQLVAPLISGWQDHEERIKELERKVA